MSSGCFACGIDEAPIDTFYSNDSRGLNHIAGLMNERGPTNEYAKYKKKFVFKSKY